jgi:hypothetical protein
MESIQATEKSIFLEIIILGHLHHHPSSKQAAGLFTSTASRWYVIASPKPGPKKDIE